MKLNLLKAAAVLAAVCFFLFTETGWRIFLPFLEGVAKAVSF